MEIRSQRGFPPQLEKSLANHARLFHSSHTPDGEIFILELFSLDDGDHFANNATTSVASLRGLIGSIPER